MPGSPPRVGRNLIRYLCTVPEMSSGKFVFMSSARAGDPAPGLPDGPRSGLVRPRFGPDLVPSGPDGLRITVVNVEIGPESFGIVVRRFVGHLPG